MISLRNILKSGHIIFKEDVYTVETKNEEPSEMINLSPVLPAASKPETVDEEALLQRLRFRLEEERRAVLKQANDEAGFIRNQAYQTGYEAGFAERTGEIDTLLRKNDALLQEINTTVQKKLDELEDGIAILSLEISEKILNRKIENDDLVLLELVRKAMEEARNAEWVSVTLSNRLRQNYQELEQELRSGKVTGKVEVQYRDVPAGTCVVETPGGVIDASVQTQLNNLRSMLF